MFVWWKEIVFVCKYSLMYIHTIYSTDFCLVNFLFLRFRCISCLVCCTTITEISTLIWNSTRSGPVCTPLLGSSLPLPHISHLDSWLECSVNAHILTHAYTHTLSTHTFPNSNVNKFLRLPITTMLFIIIH